MNFISGPTSWVISLLTPLLVSCTIRPTCHSVVLFSLSPWGSPQHRHCSLFLSYCRFFISILCPENPLGAVGNSGLTFSECLNFPHLTSCLYPFAFQCDRTEVKLLLLHYMFFCVQSGKSFTEELSLFLPPSFYLFLLLLLSLFQ